MIERLKRVHRETSAEMKVAVAALLLAAVALLTAALLAVWLEDRADDIRREYTHPSGVVYGNPAI